jgi:hypothetical protein
MIELAQVRDVGFEVREPIMGRLISFGPQFGGFL